MPRGIRLGRSRSLANQLRETWLDLAEEIRRFFTSNDGFLPFPASNRHEQRLNLQNIVWSVLFLILLSVLVVLMVVNGSVLEMARFENDWQQFYKNVIVPQVYIQPKPQKTRGIVYTAAGADVTSLLTSILTLRRHGCDLEIEVYTFHGELNSTQKKAIKSLENVDLFMIEDAKLPIPFPMDQPNLNRDTPDESIAQNQKRKYFIKPAAVLASRFDFVLYLDSDNFATADPTFLFQLLDGDSSNYTAIFWPDYRVTSPSQPLWRAMHLQYRREFEFESAQMLIDKTRSQEALNLALYLNMYNAIDATGKPTPNPSDNVLYKYVHGDKDTFMFAWNATSTPYYFVPLYARPAGHGSSTSFCGHTMAQSIPPILVNSQLIAELYPRFSASVRSYKDVNLPPLFLHLNAAKYAGKSWEAFWPDLLEQGPWRVLVQYKPDAQRVIAEARGWTSTYPGAFPFRTVLHDDLPIGTYCIGLGGGAKMVDFVNVTNVLPAMNRLWIESHVAAKLLQ